MENPRIVHGKCQASDDCKCLMFRGTSKSPYKCDCCDHDKSFHTVIGSIDSDGILVPIRELMIREPSTASKITYNKNQMYTRAVVGVSGGAGI